MKLTELRPGPSRSRRARDHGMETRPGSASPTVPSGTKLKSPQGRQGARVPWATLPTRRTGNRPLRGSYARSRYGLSWKGLDFALTRYGAPLYAYEGSLRPGGTTRNYRPSQHPLQNTTCLTGEFSTRRRAERHDPLSWGGPRDVVLQTVGSSDADVKIRVV